jgi:ribonuclease D
LSDPQINKILHAAGEDLTVLQLVIGEVPRNLWDTQIMAAFAGEPLAASYTDLVQRYLQVTLSKQLQRADWLQRPLPVQQLEYAASDAYYLLPLADKLQSLLTATPWRLAAVQEECQTLIRQRTAAVDQQLLYQRIKGHQKLSPRSSACLQRLTIWRFSEAIARNCPLGRIATDAELWQIAARLQSLALSPALLHRYAPTLLSLVKRVGSYRWRHYRQ